MLFDNNDMMDYTFLDLAGLTNNGSNLDLFTAKEGFLRGNMFKDEYKPYKNLTFINIKPKNDREAKLYNVMQYCFAINDLNLYLDVNPNDMSALNVLKELIREEERAKEEYVSTYGPLKVSDVSGNTFSWIKGPWPWEDERGSMYV